MSEVCLSVNSDNLIVKSKVKFITLFSRLWLRTSFPSLMPHLDELRISRNEQRPHIIGITETKIDSTIT